MAATNYSGFLRRASRAAAYWTRLAMRDFTEELVRRMESRSMTNAGLAEAAGVTPAYITKVLRGSENFTLQTMTKLAMAVGGKVRIHIADRQAQTYWLDSVRFPAPAADPATQALSVFEVHDDQIVDHVASGGPLTFHATVKNVVAAGISRTATS